MIGGADYYQPGVNIIDDEGSLCLPLADRVKKILRPKGPGIYSGESVATSLCHGNWLYFPAIMWRTSTVQKYRFNETQHNTQDLITELSIIKDGGSMFVDDRKTFLYRRSNASFSSKAKGGSRFTEENATYDRLANELRDMGWRKASRAARLHVTVRLHQLLS